MVKMLDFNISLRKQYYDCYDVMIMTLCDYFKADGSKMFCWRWGFNYSSRKTARHISLYDNMYINRDNDEVCRLLEKYIGLTVRGFHYTSFEDFERFVEKNITVGLPVGIVINTVNCPWNPLYRLQSIRHCALIFGYDEDKYYLKEPYFSQETLAIDRKIFNSELVMLQWNVKFEKPTEYKFWDMVKNGFAYVYGDNYCKYDSLMEYAEDLRELVEIDLKDDLSMADVRYIPSLRAMRNLSSEREGLLFFLSSNSDVVPRFIIELVKHCVEKWKVCLNLYIRLYLTRNTKQVDKIAELIREIATIEKEIHIETLKYVSFLNEPSGVRL